MDGVSGRTNEKAKDLATRVNNIFNVSDPELVEVPDLTRFEINELDRILREYLDGEQPRYPTKSKVKVYDGNTEYVLLVRRKENA